MSAKRILIVDNRSDITLLYGCLLARLGYDVMEENDSMHVLEAAREFKPDLMLLDVCMPGMGGCEIAKQFAAEESFKSLPVVFMGGGSGREASNAMHPAPVVFLEKPIDLKMLFSCIRERVQSQNAA